MKKLNITEGSLTPFWMKDLDYMQQGFSEALVSVIQGLGLGNKNMLISGCEVKYSNGKVSMTAGWCYYEGEILKVDAMAETACSDTTPRVRLDKKRKSDSSGTRQIVCSGETSMSEVYEEWYLEPSLVDDNSTVGYRLAIGEGAWRLGERIMYKSRAVDSGMVKIDINMYIGRVEYRMIGGVVQLYGSINNTEYTNTGMTGTVAKNLPRPAQEIKIGDIKISSNGELSVNSGMNTVRLDGVVYLATPKYANDDGHYSTTGENGGGIVS